MKVSDPKLGRIDTALTPEKLEQLNRCRTTRYGNPIEVTPFEPMNGFRPHPTIGQDACAINLVECLQVVERFMTSPMAV